jgi:hypothetical protein
MAEGHVTLNIDADTSGLDEALKGARRKMRRLERASRPRWWRLRIRRLRLKPGDVLIVTTAVELDALEASWVRDAFQQLGVPAMVLGPDAVKSLTTTRYIPPNITVNIAPGSLADTAQIAREIDRHLRRGVE